MTYPSPSTRRRIPHHTAEEMLELEARTGIYASALPSSRVRAEMLDSVTGMMATSEAGMRGWTAQQPFVHVDCPVMHRCVMCALTVDPDYLRDHARDCKVERELVRT